MTYEVKDKEWSLHQMPEAVKVKEESSNEKLFCLGKGGSRRRTTSSLVGSSELQSWEAESSRRGIKNSQMGRSDL